MLHFVTSYMKQNKSRKQTLKSAQYGLEISFNSLRGKAILCDSQLVMPNFIKPSSGTVCHFLYMHMHMLPTNSTVFRPHKLFTIIII